MITLHKDYNMCLQLVDMITGGTRKLLVWAGVNQKGNYIPMNDKENI